MAHSGNLSLSRVRVFANPLSSFRSTCTPSVLIYESVLTHVTFFLNSVKPNFSPLIVLAIRIKETYALLL